MGIHVFASVAALDDALADPSEALVADLATGRGAVVVLGAGGKMGPSLCRLTRRGLDAAGRDQDKVYAVSRWTDVGAARELTSQGIECVSFDLLGSEPLSGLPDAENVVFMVGAKFGTAGSPELAWSVNALLPGKVAERYVGARTAVFSTGNIYPYVPVTSIGSVETDRPEPVGEYGMTCLARERIFQYAAVSCGTPVSIVRLNYAIDLRYGVLADIATAVRAGLPIDVETGHLNAVWQGYANEVALRSLMHASAVPFVINLTGPETVSVRRAAHRFAELFGTQAQITGVESDHALLSDATRCHQLFGYPALSLGSLIAAQAAWLDADLPMLDKPTKFGVRDGRF
jgi:nucleoside-diphosphate-sugar epimerase